MYLFSKTLVIIFLSLLSFQFSFSQMIINQELLTMPVLITLPNISVTGSGFFYNDSNFVYLVTAKHVILDVKKHNLLDSQIVIYNYPYNPESDLPNILNIDLNKLLKLHKIIFSKDQDICAIEIAKNRFIDSNTVLLDYNSAITKSGQSTRVSTYNKFNCSVYDSVKASTDLYIFGYPSSLSKGQQFDPLRPLLRKGVIAGKNSEQKSFILDCPAYPGNSGGPVVIQEQTKLGYFVYHIVGIITDYVPFVDYWESKSTKQIIHQETYNSGLSVAISIDHLFDLIQEYYKTKP